MLYTAFKRDGGIGELQDKLAAAGLSLGDLKMTQMGALSEVALGSMDSVQSRWNDIKGKATAQEVAEVDGVSGEEFRKAVIRLTAKYDTSDPGDELRRINADISNNIQKLAENLIPATLTMKDGILELVKDAVPNSPYVKKLNEIDFKQQAQSDPLMAEMINQFADAGGGDARKKLYDFYRRDFESKGIHASSLIRKVLGNEQEPGTKYRDLLKELNNNPDFGRVSVSAMDKQIAAGAANMGGNFSGRSAPAGGVSERLISDLMRNEGLTREQAAGVVGNLHHESGGFSSMQEKNPLSGRGGYGYAQWTGKRREAFEKWSALNGLGVSSYEANYGFLSHELNTSHKSVLNHLRGSGSVADATSIFANEYEVPGVMAMGSRLSAANNVFENDIMPSGSRSSPKKSKSHNVNFNGTFTLNDSMGNKIAESLDMFQQWRGGDFAGAM